MAEVRHITVTPEEGGQKLLQFLQRRLGRDIPKGALMRWIRTGQVRINKGRVKPFDRLEAGDVVRIPPHDAGSSPATPAPHGVVPGAPSCVEDDLAACGLSLVARAEDLLVLAKPAGLPVQPGTGHDDAVTTRLARCFASAPFMPTPAHRLDRDTSGLLLVATSYRRLQGLHSLLREGHALQKIYLAWVRGIWPEDGPERMHDALDKRTTGTGERGGERMVRVEDGGADVGKAARSTVVPVLRRGNVTLLAVSIHTGRTHQIRVQLSARGYPIVGDRKYGGPAEPQGMLLHAWRVVLPGLEPSETPEEIFQCLPAWHGLFAVQAEALAGIAKELDSAVDTEATDL